MKGAVTSKSRILLTDGATDTTTLSDAPDVLDIGSDLFESEDIVDKTYEVFLKMMSPEEFKSNRPSREVRPDIGDFALAYTDGVYLCGVRRSIITHQYDPRNDTVPSELSVWVGDGCIQTLREVPRVPREWRTPAALGRHFKSTMLILDKAKGEVVPGLVSLMPDGRIIPAQVADGFHWRSNDWVHGISSLQASVAINLYCDRLHLWQVRTAEETLGANWKTPLNVGVSPEHIKSLFYARSLPVTESGRKRPILHWVRSHKRRIAEGIDVDIKKYLRGIEAFEMGGFDWRITNPTKGTLAEMVG